MKRPFDSIIFDMDGTLWDAVDSYCAVWREAYGRLNLDLTVTRQQLLQCMGLPVAEIFKRVAPDAAISFERFLPVLRECEAKLMPRLGGKLYPGVREGLATLRDRGYKLFMVSNCSPAGLPNFMRFTGLGALFTDYLSYGDTGADKPENIRTLVERHSLKAPIYVGDIDADCRSAHRAGVPMLWVSYGFGHCTDAEFSADSFAALTDLFIPLHDQTPQL